MSAAGVDCSEDYVLIPGAENNPAMGAIPTAAGALCGRAFSVLVDVAAIIYDPAAHLSVCSRLLPFQVGVHFDSDEVSTGVDSATNEEGKADGGILGFSLNYQQIMC
ncbi:hypothetical protein TCAL_15290 [Tigriopus californicus]|uniref:CUB domain-containing protein n=1 Tax=Tigriopus californicus TaxID=6832 RepID=A0A553PKC3_TIGCA|nr:uncharacterized protein LOC131890274 [Tigriopus californicus]TRY78131.1 hypothetical protein TCAL_15290 [Tigriopus californicus]